MKRTKVSTKTAKLVKCKYCGDKLTRASKETHNSRAFYDLDHDGYGSIPGDYLCNKTKCTTDYLSSIYPRVKNDGDNELETMTEAQRELHRLNKKYGCA